MPTRPTAGTHIPTLGNFKAPGNNNIPKSGKPSNYFKTTYYSEKPYMPPSNFVSFSGYDLTTCGISTKDVILAGSFKNNKNFETIQSTKLDGREHFKESNHCFSPVVGRGRGRLNSQDNCKSNRMLYYR